MPRWLELLGYDTSDFPRERPKVAGDLERVAPEKRSNIRTLLSAIPEIGDLYLRVFDDQPSWLVPALDTEGALGPRVAGAGSTYVQLLDSSSRIEGARIDAAGWPIAELRTAEEGEHGRSFRVRVDHAGYKFWYQILPIHRSPSRPGGALILPVIAGVSEYRAIAFSLLYALSILVRYRPGAWRRVEDGDWDAYLTLERPLLGTFERLLPEQFLESITGEHVTAAQPGWG